MGKNQEATKLAEKIESIKQKITELEEIRPGSLSKQYNVCGTPNCKCKDKEKPQKHGPYYQLSYTHKSRGKTEFIRKQDLEITKKAVENYKEFMALRDEWIEASIELAKSRKSQGRKTVKA